MVSGFWVFGLSYLGSLSCAWGFGDPAHDSRMHRSATFLPELHATTQVRPKARMVLNTVHSPMEIPNPKPSNESTLT